MLSAETVGQIEAAAWFADTTRPYLLVDAGLQIRAVNRRYEEVTIHPRSVLLGRGLFDVFPDDPGDRHADGVANLSASFERVLTTGETHWMGVQRHHVPDLSAPGRFVPKVWVPVNSPIRRDGETVGILHHVEDVTATAQLTEADDPSVRLDLVGHARSLWQEFPGLDFSAVLGVAASSYQVVLQALGHPHAECAEAVARLRLEQLAPRPPQPLGPGEAERELAVPEGGAPGSLDEATCLRLLVSHDMGRVALSVGALPAIFPVAYRISGNSIYLRVRDGSPLSAALAGGVVAFAVDSIDPIRRSGWSVQVVGVARPASPLDRRALVDPPAERSDVRVKLSIGTSSGRRSRDGVPEH